VVFPAMCAICGPEGLRGTPDADMDTYSYDGEAGGGAASSSGEEEREGVGRRRGRWRWAVCGSRVAAVSSDVSNRV